MATTVVPGCRVGSEEAVAGLGAEFLERIAGGRVASVCTGAFALAEARLLDGRRVTTHHDVQDELARRFPAVKVVPDVLYVVDERVATSAGVASGIDLALHVIAVDHGPALAARVARSMVVPARRNGASPQESAMLRHRDHLSDVVHRAQDVLDRRFAEPLPLRELAQDAGVSERTLSCPTADSRTRGSPTRGASSRPGAPGHWLMTRDSGARHRRVRRTKTHDPLELSWPSRPPDAEQHPPSRTRPVISRPSVAAASPDWWPGASWSPTRSPTS